MKNVSRTKKMNSFTALVVMMALLVMSIGMIPSEAEGTFTVVTSPCTVTLNSFSYAKKYITVKDGDKVLVENVDYNYGSDILKASTTMVTGSGGMWVWTGTIYGMGEYSGETTPVSLFYTVTVPAAPGTSSSTTQATDTTQQTVSTTPSTTDVSTTENSTTTTTNITTTTTSTSTEKPIEGTVTFKKFMEKYCNYGVFPKKDGTGYTIGKTSNSKSGPTGSYPCSPKYQYKVNTIADDGTPYKRNVGFWETGWDKNTYGMADISLPARLWKKYTADGETDAINCMLDDFEKLPVYEKQLHISNFTYGQILKAAAKVGRTVDVAVLPLNSSVGLYSYGVNTDSDGVYISYRKVRVNTYLYDSSIASSVKPVNKFEVTWKCKGDTSWRTGSCGTLYPAVYGLGAVSKPMGKGNVYDVKGKQTNYWKNVTEIKVRQYRTINGKKYYTDWLTVYKNGKKVKSNTSSTAATSSTTTKVKKKTVTKGKRIKVKVSYSKQQKITWKSSNPKVAKVVKRSGKYNTTITIKGRKAGKTTITGKGKGKTFKIKVTVKKKK